MRGLIWILVISILVSFSGTSFAQMCPMGKMEEDKTGEKGQKAITECIGNKMVCPVMGTAFKADKDTKSYKYDGKIYYLCCPSCVEKFKADPKKYIGDEKSKSPSEHH